MRPTLVLFDIDGTLLRGAGTHHKEALLEGIRRVTGLETSFEGLDTAGKLDMDLIAALLQAAGGSADAPCCGKLRTPPSLPTWRTARTICGRSSAAVRLSCWNSLRGAVRPWGW